MRQQHRGTAPGSATLIVVGGLPGTGKTTIAKRVVASLGAVYLRVDVIEQALRDSGTPTGGDVGPAGYVVAYALAASNLALGRTVVADCVNPLAITREAWRDVAARTAAAILEVEVVCPDLAEHRWRVEARAGDIPGLVPPTWAEVISREYEAWTGRRLVVDTAAATAEAAAALVLEAAAARYRVGTGDSPR